MLLLHSLGIQASDGGKSTTKASLTHVTVFSMGAEMTHVARGEMGKGNNELLIDNISNSPDINSLQVNCSGNVTVMGVTFSRDHLVMPMATPATRRMEDSIETSTISLDKVKSAIGVLIELQSVLKANKEIKGSQTGLSVVELVKLMDYYKTKSIEIQNELRQQYLLEKNMDKVIGRLKEQLAEEQQKNTNTAGRLLLQLNCAVPGNYDFTISYITRNAYWTPFYDLKSVSINSPLTLVYRAKIFQTTGIDWKQVKLSLSTAAPSQGGNAPVISPWFLSYINPISYLKKEMALQGKLAGVTNNLNEVAVVGYGSSKVRIRGTATPASENAPLYIVNGNEMTQAEFNKISSAAVKNIEVLKSESATAMYGSRGKEGIILVTLKDGLEDYITVADKELDVTFDIDLPYDVPTNGKAQTAVLKETSIAAHYQFYAVPKLDKGVFLVAGLLDWEKLNLLPGEANIIFEGTYIGKSFIDPSTTGDTLHLTMGRDKRVIVKKEKLADFSSIKFLGSNKKQVFTYEITIRNNKKDAINIEVKDQYPISQNSEVTVEVIEKSGALENDNMGELSWKLPLAPGEVKKLRVSYSVKYPKDKTLNLQ